MRLYLVYSCSRFFNHDTYLYTPEALDSSVHRMVPMVLKESFPQAMLPVLTEKHDELKHI